MNIPNISNNGNVERGGDRPLRADGKRDRSASTAASGDRAAISADAFGAKAAFEANVDAARGELDERRRRDQFEERRRGLRILGADGLVMRTQVFGVGDHFGVGKRRAVDLDAFADGDKVGARVQARAAALRALDRFDHRACRTLAVGTGDVDAGRGALRITEAGGEQAHAVHAEARTQVT